MARAFGKAGAGQFNTLYFLSRACSWSTRLRLATRAERESPACEEELVTPEGHGGCGQIAGHKKTRPSAQYNANGLASPGY
jgi:hypothetical protein